MRKISVIWLAIFVLTCNTVYGETTTAPTAESAKLIPGEKIQVFQKKETDANAEMIKRVQESIVDIQTNGRMNLKRAHTPSFVEFWAADYMEKDVKRQISIPFSSQGTGVIIDSSGLVLTNFHVVSAFDEIKVKIGKDKIVDAVLIGKSKKHDLALLRIEGGGDLKPIEMADSSQAQLTDTVYAIGNPYSYSKTVTKGTISGLDREIKLYDGATFEHLIQTDIAVNPGNSGGALINEKGEMLGIVTIGDRRTNNIGFSIPTNIIRQVLPELKTSVYQSEGYKTFMQRFGLTVQEMKDPGGSSFLIVSDIQPRSEAYQAGIRANDVLIGFEQKLPTNLEELLQEAAKINSGQNVYVRIQRDKQIFFTYIGAK